MKKRVEWWKRNNMRLIQTNLRELDANADVDELIRELTDLRANVLLMNTGGVTAFYPTDLEHHFRARGQKKDLIGEAITKCHENGIRFMARFDFSKADETIFAQRPEWFYRSADGREINYHGMVHTCVNGDYQQHYSLKIIEEVLERYDVDGIFFNMFGYQTGDYSGNHYGECYCDNCQRRFKEMYGESLPTSTDPQDPLVIKHREFKKRTTEEVLERIHHLVKTRWPHVAISTYHDHMVDIVKKESNTALRRPLPKWLYSASENVQSVQDSYEDKLISDVCINATDITYRFVGVSKHEVAIRLYESIAAGSGMDFCIIGVFDGYPDKANMDTVKHIYRFHAENEQYFGRFQSMAEIALVKPSSGNGDVQSEYRGIYKMLKEGHHPFDVRLQKHVSQQLRELSQYRIIILPDVRHLDETQIRVLRTLNEQGVMLIATNQTCTEAEGGHSFLAERFGVHVRERTRDTVPAYLQVDDKELFSRLPKRDWVLIEGDFAYLDIDLAAKTRLPFIYPAVFGPPERTGHHRRSEHVGIVLYETHETKGTTNVYLPWQIGRLYDRFGYEDHKHILLDTLDHICEQPHVLTTNAPPSTEVYAQRIDSQTVLLQFINLSGFNGLTYQAPIPVHDITVTLHHLPAPTNAFRLADKSSVPVETIVPVDMSRSEAEEARTHASSEHVGSSGAGVEQPWHVHLDRPLGQYEAVVLHWG